MSLDIITSVPIENEEWIFFNELDIMGHIELFDGGEYEDGELICFTVLKKNWPRIEKHLQKEMSGVTYHTALSELPKLPEDVGLLQMLTTL